MYEYLNPYNGYVYRGSQGCGSPVREVKTVTDAEAKQIDRLEKAIREAKKKGY